MGAILSAVTPESSAALKGTPGRATTIDPVPPAVPRPGIRHDLQGVRGVAVLGVVVFHLRASWLPGGFAGVDVFFVLSGFFITGLLLKEVGQHGTVDLWAFWGRRARRLLPASLLVLVATLLAAPVLTDPLEAGRIARDGLYATVFGMNWREAASGLAYGRDPNPSPFQHYWSLGVEEQYYLAWPLVLLALVWVWRRHSALPLRHTIVMITIPAGVGSFLLAFHQTVGNQPYAYYGTFGRVWQLAVGGLLAATVGCWKAWPSWVRSGARIAGFSVIVGFYAAAPPASRYPGWWSLLPVLGAALLVIAGEPASRREPVAGLLSSRLGQIGGRYSYSWYLWHWAPLVLLPIALGRPLRVQELCWCALATFLTAVVAYHLVEDPIRRNERLAHARAPTLRFGVALILLGLIVSQVVSTTSQDAAHARIVTANNHTLTPEPAVAAAERPVVSGDGCQLPIASPAMAPECRYLDTGGHGDVVLVGDSHAGMWFPAIESIANSNRWGLRVWARTSCPFADVRKTVAGGGEYRHCDQWRENVIRRLVAARPSLVIVTSYDQSNLHVDDPRTGAGATQARAHQLFQAGLRRNLARLRAAGLHVLLIGDVPAYTQAGPDCALTHPRDLASCSLPQADAIVDGGVDIKAARAVPGVHIADFTHDFCHRDRCYQIVKNILAYRDIDHLTTEMVLHLVRPLDAAARAAIE